MNARRLVGLGGLPPIANVGFLAIGLGVRGVALDNGSLSIGPDLEVGMQLLPVRPFGVSVTGRVALMWTRFGDVSPVTGPTLGARVWF